MKFEYEVFDVGPKVMFTKISLILFCFLSILLVMLVIRVRANGLEILSKLLLFIIKLSFSPDLCLRHSRASYPDLLQVVLFCYII